MPPLLVAEYLYFLRERQFDAGHIVANDGFKPVLTKRVTGFHPDATWCVAQASQN